MLMLWFMHIHPNTVPNMATGMAGTTAMGSLQLSYWAASTSMVMIMAKMNTTFTVSPDCVS